MNNSVLSTIKSMLGISPEEPAFDTEITTHISAVLMSLNQMGITAPCSVVDKTVTWDDILDDREDLEAVKSYIYLKVKMIFDPPTSSYVLDSMKTVMEELQWRLYSRVTFDDN